jgi:hypothetical protein
MGQYQNGQTVRLSAVFRLDGVEADPSSVSLRLSGAESRIVSSEIVKDGTGQYHYDFVPDHGIYYYKWVGSGAVTVSAQKSFVVDSE